MLSSLSPYVHRSAMVVGGIAHWRESSWAFAHSPPHSVVPSYQRRSLSTVPPLSTLTSTLANTTAKTTTCSNCGTLLRRGVACSISMPSSFSSIYGPQYPNRRFASSSSSPAGGTFDPYRILGVTPESPMKDIKTAYRRLALKYHPDRPETGNADQFRAVQEAYEALKDGKKWSPHDMGGNDGGDGGGGMSDHQREKRTTHASGAAKRGYYAYEEPGSTTENYFENDARMQTFARIVVAWCVVFIMVRIVMFQVFPLKGQAAAAGMAAEGGGAAEEPYLDASFNTSHPTGGVQQPQRVAAGDGSIAINNTKEEPVSSSTPAAKPLGFFARIEKAIADAAREDGSLAELEGRRHARKAAYEQQSAPPAQPSPTQAVGEQQAPYQSSPWSGQHQQPQTTSSPPPPLASTKYSGDYDPLGSRVTEQREVQNKQEAPGGWMNYFSNNAKDYLGEGDQQQGGGKRVGGDGESGTSGGVYRF